MYLFTLSNLCATFSSVDSPDSAASAGTTAPLPGAPVDTVIRDSGINPSHAGRSITGAAKEAAHAGRMAVRCLWNFVKAKAAAAATKTHKKAKTVESVLNADDFCECVYA